MRKTLVILAVLLACCVGAEAKAPVHKRVHAAHNDALIRLIADATAWSEMCANYAMDPAALALFRDVHRIAMDGHYVKVFGFAYARQHADAYDSNRFRGACDRALSLYGPSGWLAPGLVRPLFHGSVPDQKINLDRW
ncbi:hypothetical protein SAMN06265338_101106 [Rhodoblastus acidophilus]|uniref:TIGR02301 family protein n=1 Tax=Rhodoblastus acidophilus TaxID=1074 RepID=A0A212PX02_RHOAC|nr:hypothetical protein [Rhodoblastus acidophilus]PPQ35712.1 hypothetical protein CKO16_19905 [Rhodoblastus acidophilus]RAI17745.1 hypothetical protein CH337_15750 [Rhodoblastus acidophilus]SNB51579.1 hypothetical protein SAMN06265338_101106 [Rhodoblastus acidophilus]